MNASLETKIADALFLVLALCLPHESFARFAAGLTACLFKNFAVATECRFTCFAVFACTRQLDLQRNMYNGEHNSCNGGYYKYRKTHYRSNIYNSSSQTHLHIVYISLRTLIVTTLACCHFTTFFT